MEAVSAQKSSEAMIVQLTSVPTIAPRMDSVHILQIGMSAVTSAASAYPNGLEKIAPFQLAVPSALTTVAFATQKAFWSCLLISARL